VTHQLCIAGHRDNPPTALGGLKLCGGHHAALTEALTGPSAAEDPTIDAVWGLRSGGQVVVQGARERAVATQEYADWRSDMMRRPRYELVCGDGITWQAPRDYRPGGLVRDYTALTLRMTGLSTGDKTPYVVRSTEVPLPVPDSIAELRSQIRHDLAYWVARHATDGSTRPPAPGAEPVQLAAWLAVHRDWAAARDWAGNYVSVLQELRASARRLIDLPRAPRAPVASCPEHGCDGILWSAIREEHDPRPSMVQCNTCDAEWDSTQWMRLGVRLGRAS
jgi:hypothetical protein